MFWHAAGSGRCRSACRFPDREMNAGSVKHLLAAGPLEYPSIPECQRPEAGRSRPQGHKAGQEEAVCSSGITSLQGTASSLESRSFRLDFSGNGSVAKVQEAPQSLFLPSLATVKVCRGARELCIVRAARKKLKLIL